MSVHTDLLLHLSLDWQVHSIQHFCLRLSLSSLLRPIYVFAKFTTSLRIQNIGTDARSQMPRAHHQKDRPIQTLSSRSLGQTQTKSFLVCFQR